MIEVKASTRREFLFPAPVSQALEFFGNFRRITQFLTHISLVKEYENGRYRLLYSTVEMATYEVHIFADVATEVDMAAKTLTVSLAPDIPPVRTKATLTSLTAPGSYNSRSYFREAGEFQCEIEYVMELGAMLPQPLGLKLIPGNLLNSVADNITHRRMDEIIDGFIAKSIRAYAIDRP